MGAGSSSTHTHQRNRAESPLPRSPTPPRSGGVRSELHPAPHDGEALCIEDYGSDGDRTGKGACSNSEPQRCSTSPSRTVSNPLAPPSKPIASAPSSSLGRPAAPGETLRFSERGCGVQTTPAGLRASFVSTGDVPRQPLLVKRVSVDGAPASNSCPGADDSYTNVESGSTNATPSGDAKMFSVPPPMVRVTTLGPAQVEQQQLQRNRRSSSLVSLVSSSGGSFEFEAGGSSGVVDAGEPARRVKGSPRARGGLSTSAGTAGGLHQQQQDQPSRTAEFKCTQDADGAPDPSISDPGNRVRFGGVIGASDGKVRFGGVTKSPGVEAGGASLHPHGRSPVSHFPNHDRLGAAGGLLCFGGISSSVVTTSLDVRSAAAGMSRASVVSFALNAVVPFDFLNDQRLKHDPDSEAALHHERRGPSEVVIPSLIITSDDITHGSPPAIGDISGPCLVIGDCGEDIVAVLLVLNLMEAYCVEEHGRLLSTLFAYVVASGSGAYVALALSEGQTIKSLLELLLENDEALLLLLPPTQPQAPASTSGEAGRKRPSVAAGASQRRIKKTVNSVRDDAFTVASIEAAIALKYADERSNLFESGESGTAQPERRANVSSRYRRGDHYVCRPMIIVAQGEAGDLLRRVDWVSDASIPRLYALTANCAVASLTAGSSDGGDQGNGNMKKKKSGGASDGDGFFASLFSSFTGAGSNNNSGKPRPLFQTLSADDFRDPLLFVFQMEPRPTAVMRISLSRRRGNMESSDDDEHGATLLATETFGADFIDVTLPHFSDVPPPAPTTAGGQPNHQHQHHRHSRNSLSSCASLGAAVPLGQNPVADDGAGLFSCSTIGLEGPVTPLEALLQQWRVSEGVGSVDERRRRRAHVMSEADVFLEEVEGTLQRAVDYLATRSARAQVKTPPQCAVISDVEDDLDMLFS